MSTPDLNTLLEQAITHVNAGELREGRALLERILERDPKNDHAWVWLSGCVEDTMQRRICLQQALSANPHNQAALDGMSVLDGEMVQASKQPPSLLDSRLSDDEFPPEEPTAEGTVTSMSSPSSFEQTGEEMGEQRPRRRMGLLILAVAVLFFFICALVVVVVIPPLLQTL